MYLVHLKAGIKTKETRRSTRWDTASNMWALFRLWRQTATSRELVVPAGCVLVVSKGQRTPSKPSQPRCRKASSLWRKSRVISNLCFVTDVLANHEGGAQHQFRTSRRTQRVVCLGSAFSADGTHEPIATIKDGQSPDYAVS